MTRCPNCGLPTDPIPDTTLRFCSECCLAFDAPSDGDEPYADRLTDAAGGE